MTTITIKTTQRLSQTHFQSLKECVDFFKQYAFETELEESVKKGMKTPTSKFARL